MIICFTSDNNEINLYILNYLFRNEGVVIVGTQCIYTDVNEKTLVWYATSTEHARGEPQGRGAGEA